MHDHDLYIPSSCHGSAGHRVLDNDGTVRADCEGKDMQGNAAARYPDRDSEGISTKGIKKSRMNIHTASVPKEIINDETEDCKR